jgi:phytoene dehydrogenase-like protein
MGEIPKQIAGRLPDGLVSLQSPVAKIDESRVELENGEQIQAKAVVVATEEPAAARLLGRDARAVGRSVTCVYFAADSPPIDEPILVLNGDGIGPINNLCIPSQVSSHYAPPGQALVSATVLGDPKLDDERLAAGVLNQLVDWFGKQAEAWRYLKSYRIHYALPRQEPPALSPVEKSATVGDGIFLCGDYCDLGSLNGAMASGRRAAEAVMHHLS